MKVRQFVATTFLVDIILLILLLPGAGRPTAAQTRPSSVQEPFATSVPITPATFGAVGVQAALGNSPMMFIENVGQFATEARFQADGGNYTIWLAEDALWVTVWGRTSPLPSPTSGREPRRLSPVDGEMEGNRRGVRLRLRFVGANPHPRLEPFNRLDTHVSYFIGNDPTRWHADVPVWGGVCYRDLYPGIDLEISGEGGRWTWRLVFRDARPAIRNPDVRLRVEGADTLALDGDRLHLVTAVGDLALPLLTVTGITPSGHPAVLDMEQGTLEVASPFAAAIPDPQPAMRNLRSGAADLLCSTCLGGSESDYGSSVDEGYGIAVDASGAAYVVGTTNSSDFPTTTGAFDTIRNGDSDAFVVKLSATGSTLVYATFLGGSYSEDGFGIAVDARGAAYVTGWTNSTNFPTTPDALDTSYGGDWDAFVVKLSATGSTLVYGTFLGSSGTESGKAIVVDGNGAAYVTGWTRSSNFPTTPGAFDTTYNGDDDGFVVKLNSTGSVLSYATFLGGSSWDAGYGIAVDAGEAAYITGLVESSDFPVTADAFDRSLGGTGDAFVVKLNSAGSALSYSTFLGGSSWDRGYGIAIDESEAAYITGLTESADFPATPGAFDATYNGAEDGFVVKLNPAGSALAYSTFLGGSVASYLNGDDYGKAIAVDGDGMAHVTGWTNSFDFPSTPDAFDPSFNGGYALLCAPPDHICPDAFVVKLNAAGSALAYATFLGAPPDEWGTGIAVDGDGVAYVVGTTGSSTFPTTPDAFDTSCNDGGPDAFVTKLAMGGESIYLPLIVRNR